MEWVCVCRESPLRLLTIIGMEWQWMMMNRMPNEQIWMTWSLAYLYREAVIMFKNLNLISYVTSQYENFMVHSIKVLYHIIRTRGQSQSIPLLQTKVYEMDSLVGHVSTLPVLVEQKHDHDCIFVNSAFTFHGARAHWLTDPFTHEQPTFALWRYCCWW